MMNRRNVLRAVFTSVTVAIVGALVPRIVLAAWNKQAFAAKDQQAVMGALYDGTPLASADIHLKAPDIAENGAVVPITVKTTLPDVRSISIIVAKNPLPLATQFMLASLYTAQVFV